MAKFCGKCGAKLNKKNGLCPKCNSKKKKISLLKIMVTILCLFIVLTGVTGILVYYNIVDIPIASSILDSFGISRNEVEKDSDQAINSLTSGDIKAVNAVIFKEYNAITYSDYAELFETENKEQTSENGVLARLFSMSKIRLIDYDESSITYQIEAPNMTDFFSKYKDKAESIVDEEMLAELIIEYAEETEHKSTEVTVSYAYIEDEFIADYQSYDFINAISGGLLDAYTTLYSEMIDEYRNGVMKE